MPPSTFGNVEASDVADPALGVGRWNDGAVLGDGEPAVVVDEQLVVGGIPDDALLLGDATEPGEGGRDVGLAGFGTRFVTSGGRQQRRRADGLDAAGEQVGAEGQRRQWRDDGIGALDVVEFVGDPRELLEVRALVELGDVGAVVRGEQQDDGLATEVLLERHVVDGDLRVRVEVAVLARREVDVARPESEEHRDHDDPGCDELPVLAQCHTEPPPESFHPHVPTPLVELPRS